jgi:hypothetical protein
MITVAEKICLQNIERHMSASLAQGSTKLVITTNDLQTLLALAKRCASTETPIPHAVSPTWNLTDPRPIAKSKRHGKRSKPSPQES